jgi:hypothetical protein
LHMPLRALTRECTVNASVRCSRGTVDAV